MLNVVSVSNNQIITPSGMHYLLLVLDSNSRQMTLPVLKKIYSLVKSGASIVGLKPTGSPGLNEDKATYNSIVNELWPDNSKVNSIGSGKVFGDQSITRALAALKAGPDFEYSKPHANTRLLYVHRTLQGQEIYWVNNRTDSTENLEATFRVSGKNVEIWRPETGSREQSSYTFTNGRTQVPLHLEPNEAYFVVFSGNAIKTSRSITQSKETLLASIDGPWKLSFQNKFTGVPAGISIDKLSSWTDNKDADIKYFSGTGVYTDKINCPASWFRKDTHLWLDLGNVKNLAEVIVNGKSVGITWKKPFRVELTSILKPGENTLEIRVTNLWVNRLIGDLQPGIQKKYTYTTMPFYKPDSPLLPSGLLGPVRLFMKE